MVFFLTIMILFEEGAECVVLTIHSDLDNAHGDVISDASTQFSMDGYAEPVSRYMMFNQDDSSQDQAWSCCA